MFDIKTHPRLDLVTASKFFHHRIVICHIVACYVPDLKTGE
jgi:hypothetical protein